MWNYPGCQRVFFLLFAVKIERCHAPHDRGFAAQFSLQITGKKTSGTQGYAEYAHPRECGPV